MKNESLINLKNMFVENLCLDCQIKIVKVIKKKNCFFQSKLFKCNKCEEKQQILTKPI